VADIRRKRKVRKEKDMNSVKAWLQDRFPDQEKAIQRLWGIDKGFEATSHELQQVEVKLDKLNADVEPADPNEVERLRSRRNALVGELGMLMGANLR
jgi:predicted nuclease with TOPRIM domain